MPHKTKENGGKCPLCDAMFKTRKEKQCHTKEYHNSFGKGLGGGERTPTIGYCKFCNRRSRTKTGLILHEKCCKLNPNRIDSNGTNRKHSDETKAKLREKRLKYMKEHPENTAGRLGNEPSGPEKQFMKALKTHGGYNEFEIVREKCFFPYYADFAFENVKVVVEIDGTQHKETQRKQSDLNKDNVIKKSGGRVYRVAANKMLDSTIESVLFELKEFIGNVELKGYTSEILTSKKQRKEKIIKKNKENKDVKDKKIKEKQLLISNSGINFSKYGGVNKVAKILNITHTHAALFVKTKMPELYLKCRHRKTHEEMLKIRKNYETEKAQKQMAKDTRKREIYEHYLTSKSARKTAQVFQTSHRYVLRVFHEFISKKYYGRLSE